MLSDDERQQLNEIYAVAKKADEELSALREELQRRNELLDEVIRPLVEDRLQDDHWWRDGDDPPV